MNYRRLGRTGLKVSTICLGTMQWGWSATEADDTSTAPTCGTSSAPPARAMAAAITSPTFRAAASSPTDRPLVGPPSAEPSTSPAPVATVARLRVPPPSTTTTVDVSAKSGIEVSQSTAGERRRWPKLGDSPSTRSSAPIPSRRATGGGSLQRRDVMAGVEDHRSRSITRRRHRWALGSVLLAAVVLLSSCGPASLWGWGWSSSGQVGDGTSTNRVSPTEVTDGTWRSISAGRQHTCGVRPDRSLWCWGANASGQLGRGSTLPASVPTQIGSSPWTAVSAGFASTCGLHLDGSLWCWGENPFGELGDGTSTNRSTPLRIGTATWKSVSSGSRHTCAIRSNDTLWCWGRNLDGEIGDGTLTNRTSPVQIGTALPFEVEERHPEVLAQGRQVELLGFAERRRHGQDPGRTTVGDEVPKPGHAAGQRIRASRIDWTRQIRAGEPTPGILVFDGGQDPTTARAQVVSHHMSARFVDGVQHLRFGGNPREH